MSELLITKLTRLLRYGLLQTHLNNRFGLNREIVLLRSVLITCLVACSILLAQACSYYVLVYNEAYSFFSLGFFIAWTETLAGQSLFLWAGVIAVFWALHTSFTKEYDNKYQLLARMANDILPRVQLREKGLLPRRSRMYIEREYLNFAEYCLFYHMQKHTSFADIFLNIIAVLFKLQEDKKNYVNLILREHKIISQYLNNLNERQKNHLIRIYEQILDIDGAWDIIDPED